MMLRFFRFGLLWASIAMGLAGCAHRVVVMSEPAGAVVKMGKRNLGVTPVEFKTRWWPWRDMPVRVSASGYRAVELDLVHDLGPFRLAGEICTFQWGTLVGGKPRTTHTVLMVRVHGLSGSGSWDPEHIRK